MSLYIETRGQGRDVVLLHGWGMNGDVWEGIVPALWQHYRVTLVDLPGHGRSVDDLGDFSLGEMAAQISAAIPAPACLVGWSLGGMIATRIAVDKPEVIKQLVLVASAPRFVRDNDWPDGVEPEVLDGFASDLQEDFHNTVKRFIAIQAMGSEHAREEQRTLRERVFRHGNPQLAALEGGLNLLHHADLRPCLGELRCPTLLIAGEHDSLFRRAAAERTQQLIHDAQLSVIKGAGHAPFLSHPDDFLHALTTFLDEHPAP
jgi:pimeloyl-[acyl-carrier protein] methyl ester esterase